MKKLLSFLAGGTCALALLYLAYLAGMLWQFETMAHAQLRTVTLAIGRFGGTDQEIQECDFSIGQGAMLMLHPKGEACQIARDMIGRTGMLIFVPD